MLKLQDFIVEVPNVASHDLCDRILGEYADCLDWEEPKLSTGVVNKTYRNCSIIRMSYMTDEKRKQLDSEVFQAFSYAIREYQKMFREVVISQDSGYDLLRYEIGGYYVQHTDDYANSHRVVSCSLALNDDYEGGEWAFFDDEYRTKVNKGSVILFPSNFMYPHQILTVTKGTRYSIVSWFR